LPCEKIRRPMMFVICAISGTTYNTEELKYETLYRMFFTAMLIPMSLSPVQACTAITSLDWGVRCEASRNLSLQVNITTVSPHAMGCIDPVLRSNFWPSSIMDGSPSQGLRWHMRLADQAVPPALHHVPIHCQLHPTTWQTNTRATASGNGHSPFSHVLGLLLVHTSNPINSSFFFLHTPTSSPNISRATDYLILPPTISYFLLLSSKVLG